MYGEIFVSWILQLFAIKLKNDFFWKTFFHPRQLTTPTPTTQNLYPRPTAFSYTRPVLCLTVQLIKPWTPEIFKECYCDARNKPMRCEITKPQTALVICLWFWGLLAYPELYCDWPEHDQHSWKFSGVHGFLSLTVIFRPPSHSVHFQNWPPGQSQAS